MAGSMPTKESDVYESTESSEDSSGQETEPTKTTEPSNHEVEKKTPRTKPPDKLDKKLCDELSGRLTEIIMTSSILRTMPERSRTTLIKKTTFSLVITPIIEFYAEPEVGREKGRTISTEPGQDVTKTSFLSTVRRDNSMYQATKIKEPIFVTNNPRSVFNKAIGKVEDPIHPLLAKMRDNPEFCEKVDSDLVASSLMGENESEPFLVPLEIKLLSSSTSEFDVPLTINLSNVLFTWEEICDQRRSKTKELLLASKRLKLKLAQKKREIDASSVDVAPSFGYVSVEEDSSNSGEVEDDSNIVDGGSHGRSSIESPRPIDRGVDDGGTNDIHVVADPRLDGVGGIADGIDSRDALSEGEPRSLSSSSIPSLAESKEKETSEPDVAMVEIPAKRSAEGSGRGPSHLKANLAKIARFSDYVCGTSDFESDQRVKKYKNSLNKRQARGSGTSNRGLVEEPNIVFSVFDREFDRRPSAMRKPHGQTHYICSELRSDYPVSVKRTFDFAVENDKDQVGYSWDLDVSVFSTAKSPGGCPFGRLGLPNKDILDLQYEVNFTNEIRSSPEFGVTKERVERFFGSHEIHFLEDEMCSIVDRYNQIKLANSHQKRDQSLNSRTTPMMYIGLATSDGITFKNHNAVTVDYKFESKTDTNSFRFVSVPTERKEPTVDCDCECHENDDSSQQKVPKVNKIQGVTALSVQETSVTENVKYARPLIAVPSAACNKIRTGLEDNLYSKIRYANFDNPVVKIGTDRQRTEEFTKFLQAQMNEKRRDGGTMRETNSKSSVQLDPIVLTFEMTYVEWK